MDDDFHIPRYARGGPSIHEEALRLRTKRLEVLAANVANADTPNYKARDINFSQALEGAMGNGHRFPGMTTTSVAHLPATPPVIEEDLLYRVPLQSSMDGNTVEMDTERVAFADNMVRMQFSIDRTASKYRNMLKLYQDMRP
ncbi:MULTISPECIES: flagellar basal body rod protein FlgB [unclassified Cupriavidus]|uniref:flagellar basal body rod protein FlgB n=1 Tax=unclassified Cupriavidus TaxID=2640874 RepID=UPI0010F9334E|nr:MULTISPECIES: flagellar basal body rod protein FlgB [unclassified Cupriavidus]MWL88976.1 flagellar basal body rod protein FlgB [Cupriavidus sp. SW-Y-13]